jgi:hypothetical protein
MATILWAAISSLTRPVLREKVVAVVAPGGAVAASAVAVVADVVAAVVDVVAEAAAGTVIEAIAAVAGIAAGSCSVQFEISKRGVYFAPLFFAFAAASFFSQESIYAPPAVHEE